MRIVNIHMTGKENFKMRNRIIQVRHYSRKMMIMMLTGAICFSSCFCETAFAKTSKVRVYDVEKGTTGFTSFTYSDNKKDESLAPSEGTGAISSASQKAVIFHQADGSTIIRKADSNGKVTLPAIRNQTGYTFLGWSTKPDQTQNPQYQAGQVIQVRKKTHLYAVMYNWQQEPDIQVNNLAAQLSEYSGIIFVGDSRTAMLRSTLKQQCSSDSLKKVGFVCKTGEGLDWMKKYGEKELLNEISGMDDNAKPVAVIFNLGVNDLIHKNRESISYDSVASDYASYMNGLSRRLTARNCELFYMSVNPCNTAMKSTRKESEIRGFNNRLRQRLNGNFTWINSYSYLMRCGYTTRCEFRGYTDDGVHYSMRTYKRIYAYAIKQIR